ncbi:SDR family oxidoreductase [Sediminitomix flava]|uniref:NADP-dependent 3-hydroxy acid dehydrogenase YdfG n=1 Tax=Sediminitomix flava TaxID=379075 RepID=A0A315Z8N7_SEDFL|nr:SDR family oxidoreductase [Sediminitomix flava]PWJ40809.1 NADP-dependent 3-hydroxy acid dehydrogenase YdfG [Sediminitomix flava]
MNKTVLITGSSSGFGKLAAKTFQREGWNVIATMRSPEKENELNQLENVLVSRLDVTNQESVTQAVNEGIEKFGKIDVLVNNAGYGGHSFLEQFSEEQIYDMFETNVFGVMRVCREVLPHMRKQKSGTVINITSMAGYMGLTLTSTYSASKWAVEGLTESMAMEYRPFGIQVKAIAPGAFGTNFVNASDNNFEGGDDEIRESATKIGAHFHTVVAQMQKQSGQVADPQEVADKIYECATTETPVHNIVGADAEMLKGMIDSMPRQQFIEKLDELLLPKA